MSYPTPEQARQLVDHFGSQHKAAAAVGYGQTTIRHWLNPEKARADKAAAQAARRAANPEKARAYARAYRAANREKIRAYRAANREKERAAAAARRAANREKINAGKRELYYRRKDEGLCVTCGEPSLSEALCIDCLTKRTVYG